MENIWSRDLGLRRIEFTAFVTVGSILGIGWEVWVRFTSQVWRKHGRGALNCINSPEKLCIVGLLWLSVSQIARLRLREWRITTLSTQVIPRPLCFSEHLVKVIPRLSRPDSAEDRLSLGR